MSHSHSHSHDHNSEGNHNKAFAVGVSLNLVFVFIEAFYGIASNSLALLADAGHNLSDVLALLLAWTASLLASRGPTEKRTYGFKKTTIFASLASAIMLLTALGGIAFESFGRFSDPRPPDGVTVIVVAAVGVVVNTATALLFVSGKKHDLNIKAAFFHMAADAGVSLGVVAAGAGMIMTGALWLDPVISLLIAAVILFGTWGLLRDSFNLLMDAVPRHIDAAGIKGYLSGIRDVLGVHDLHIWALSATETALTAHLVTANPQIDNELLWEAQRRLRDDFGVKHATLQVEKEDPQTRCMLNPRDCR